MSLSNPRQVNPAKKFIEWSGSEGKFYFYDKNKGENVYFEKEIYIVALDELTTIKGYHDHSKSGIYSNEVKNISKEKLVVKAFKGGLITSGLYTEIKGNLEGGKFAKSIYAVLITGDKENSNLELVNFQIHGSAIGSWIDAKINVDSGEIISLSASTEQLTKGTTVYYAPIIKKYKRREDIIERCTQMDIELQNYLNKYFEKPANENESATDVKINDMPETMPEDGLPF